ncbi:MAG: YbaB/EbfC family nucleoid-associated protein [Oscillospiraceae bacterium]|jgi:DNA-binding YbaB/EbfC family protein|nr:YbaB/EbfC family nucleoid-associated protein [Oscillospiraceae bacterium]
MEVRLPKHHNSDHKHDEMMRLLSQMQSVSAEIESRIESLGDKVYTAVAGGGKVTVTANSNMRLNSIEIDPELISQGDLELLGDTIVAAANEVLAKVEAEREEITHSATKTLPTEIVDF